MPSDDFLNLQHDVARHDGELDQLLKRIEELQEDLKIVIRFSNPNVVQQAHQYGQGRGSQSVWANPPPDDTEVVGLQKKYASLEGR